MDLKYLVYRWERDKRPRLFSAHQRRVEAAFAAKHMQNYERSMARFVWYTVETLDEDELLHALIEGTVVPPWKEEAKRHERRRPE